MAYSSFAHQTRNSTASSDPYPLPERRGFRLAANLLERLILTLDNVIVEHKAFTRMFVNEHKLVCLLSFVFTMGIYMSRFVGGYVLFVR